MLVPAKNATTIIHYVAKGLSLLVRKGSAYGRKAVRGATSGD